MAFAGALAGGGAALYYLSGDTEFFHATYQTLPQEGFNGIPIALLAVNNPIGVIFSGLFMSMLNIAGQQLKNLTAILPDETVLGKVTDVIENTASNLLEITKADGEKVLIPNIPVFVNRVDLENEKIFITPIEGLI